MKFEWDDNKEIVINANTPFLFLKPLKYLPMITHHALATLIIPTMKAAICFLDYQQKEVISSFRLPKEQMLSVLFQPAA